MPYDHKNLADTVYPKTVYATLRCAVGLAINEYANGGRSWAYNHTWSDHVGGLKGGVCANCGKTLKEVRVRVNPKTGGPVRKPSRIAREISQMPRDVPPVIFIGNPAGARG